MSSIWIKYFTILINWGVGSYKIEQNSAIESNLLIIRDDTM